MAAATFAALVFLATAAGGSPIGAAGASTEGVYDSAAVFQNATMIARGSFADATGVHAAALGWVRGCAGTGAVSEISSITFVVERGEQLSIRFLGIGSDWAALRDAATGNAFGCGPCPATPSFAVLHLVRAQPGVNGDLFSVESHCASHAWSVAGYLFGGSLEAVGSSES